MMDPCPLGALCDLCDKMTSTRLFTHIFCPLIPFSQYWWSMLSMLFLLYSPKRRRTLLSTLSFSGSYGWSLLGISRIVGKAAVYVSMRCLILSAIYMWICPISMFFPFLFPSSSLFLPWGFVGELVSASIPSLPFLSRSLP